MSYVFMFTIGIYTASQFKFDTPIELHRWAITSFFFVVSLVSSK